MVTTKLKTIGGASRMNRSLGNGASGSARARDSATVTIGEPPGSCDDGKPRALTMRYTGESCLATVMIASSTSVTPLSGSRSKRNWSGLL